MINTFELYKLCNKQGWFTCGTNRQYERMFNLAREGGGVKEVALIIWLCSESATCQDIESLIKQHCMEE